MSQASIDTVTNFLDSLNASNERDKQNLTVDDIILIAIKRWFRHAASSTALADSLNYRNHPYYAGASILIMSFVGLTDGAYKCGAITAIITEMINRMVKPAATQAHFLMRDVPIRIV